MFDGPALDGMTEVDPLIDAAPTTDPVPPDTGEPGATMIYTSGTTGKPKGALRTSAGDPQQGAALLGLIGYRPDDVYLTTGPLYHSGPGGFMGVAQTLGQHRDRPAQVRSGRLAAPRRHVQGHVAPSPRRRPSG